MSSTLLSRGMKHPGIILVCVLFIVAGFLRLNDLTLYNPDSTRYVILGNSLAEGKGFVDDTQPDPVRYVVHAPLYAVLLAPVEFFFPLSLTAVKVYTLFWGAAAVVLLYIWLHHTFSSVVALSGAMLLAANPLFLIYSTEPLSEIPFIAVILLQLVLLRKLDDSGESKKDYRLSWIVLTISLALVGLLREVGIAMVIAVAVHYSLKREWKRVALASLPALVLLGVWTIRNRMLGLGETGASTSNISLLFQHILTSEDSSLGLELLSRAWLSIKAYAVELGGMLFFPLYSSGSVQFTLSPLGFSTLLQFGIATVMTPLMLRGIWKFIKLGNFSFVVLVFFILYLLFILIYPVHDTRFLIPLLPLLIVFVLHGIQSFNKRLPVTLVAAILSALLLVPNFYAISKVISTNTDYRKDPLKFSHEIKSRPNQPNLYTTPWSLLGDWVESNLPKETIIAASAKELALVSGSRKVLELDPGASLPVFETLLRDHGVQYLLSQDRWDDVKTYEIQMENSRRFWFEHLIQFGSLSLSKVHSKFLNSPGKYQLTNLEKYDSARIGGLFRLGSRELIEGQYERALDHFMKVYSVAPGIPEILSQIVITQSFLGDRQNVQTLLSRLATLPQSASAVAATRVPLKAMDALREARRVLDARERAELFIPPSQELWLEGYYRRAWEISEEAFQTDSTSLPVLAWGFYVNEQLQDYRRAVRNLARMEKLDTTGRGTQLFSEILSTRVKLQTADDATTKSTLHMYLSKLYSSAELMQEAVDEAEAALGEVPANVDALVFLAQWYESRSRISRAIHYYQSIPNESRYFVQAQERIRSLQSTLASR